MSEERPDLLAADKSIIGVSTGLLAASAAASFSNPVLFIPLAVEVVRIAFRLGVQVELVAGRLQPGARDEGSWSFSVLGATELVARCAIDDFHRESVMPPRVLHALTTYLTTPLGYTET